MGFLGERDGFDGVLDLFGVEEDEFDLSSGLCYGPSKLMCPSSFSCRLLFRRFNARGRARFMLGHKSGFAESYKVAFYIPSQSDL